MDGSKSCAALIFLFCLNWILSLSSVCKEGEDPLVVLNMYNNKVFADGKEIATSTALSFYQQIFEIRAFCIPSKTRLIAVTNVLDQHQGAYLFGSLREKLVTNQEWRCVKNTSDGNWYQVKYDDGKWPQAHVDPAPAAMPNISQNARSITSSPAPSKKYYCRAWIGKRPSMHELFTSSAYATKVGDKRRLNFHLIRSFLVRSIFECVTRCVDYDECVSMNFGNSANGHDELKRCELNRGNEEISSDNVVINNEFDYYRILKP